MARRMVSLGDSRMPPLADILGEPFMLSPETSCDTLPLHHLRRDRAVLEAAQRHMDGYCLELLRMSCIASGIGDPRADVTDLLTFKIQERAVSAGLWIEQCKLLVNRTLRMTKGLSAAFSEDGSFRVWYDGDHIGEWEASQGSQKAREFYWKEPEGPHVQELAALLTYVGFPRVPEPPTVADVLGSALTMSQEETKTLAKPDVKDLAKSPVGLSKKTMALALTVCFLAGMGEWVFLLSVMGIFAGLGYLFQVPLVPLPPVPSFRREK